MAVTKQQALDYHFGQRPEKVEVVASKPCRTQRDLSLAYTPGVAIPCLEIEKNPHDAFKYTARGNLVAVISNGTAVLGLGDILKRTPFPSMTGLPANAPDALPMSMCSIWKSTPTIPMKSSSSVSCSSPLLATSTSKTSRLPSAYIEETLKKTMKIPVFHDDQHGTAIISGAALLNALEVVGKRIDEVTVVFNGAGAGASHARNTTFAWA